MSSRLGHAADLKNPRKNTHWQLDLVLPSPQMPDEIFEKRILFIPFDPEICHGTGREKGTTTFFPLHLCLSFALSLHLFTSIQGLFSFFSSALPRPPPSTYLCSSVSL